VATVERDADPGTHAARPGSVPGLLITAYFVGLTGALLATPLVVMALFGGVVVLAIGAPVLLAAGVGVLAAAAGAFGGEGSGAVAAVLARRAGRRAWAAWVGIAGTAATVALAVVWLRSDLPFPGPATYLLAGIPFVTVPASQAKVPVVFRWPDESDPGPYPIPPNAPIEGGASSQTIVSRSGAR